MRKAMMLVLTVLMIAPACGGCVRLPGEEHDFAVVLAIDRGSELWKVCARVPDYQGEGSYQTLLAQGKTLAEALARLNQSAPMELHFGQLRMLVFGQGICETDGITHAATYLGQQARARMDAALACTEEDIFALLDKMAPPSGTRLSKSLDVLLEARRAQGLIPDVTLRDAMQAGERQALLLIRVGLEDDTVRVSGSAMTDAQGRVTGLLTPAQTQLTAMLSGALREGTLSLGQGTVRLTEARSKIVLTKHAVTCQVHVKETGGDTVAGKALEELLERELRETVRAMQTAGCDALGLARQAISAYKDMETWHDAKWPERCAALSWTIEVTVEETL